MANFVLQSAIVIRACAPARSAYSSINARHVSKLISVRDPALQGLGTAPQHPFSPGLEHQPPLPGSPQHLASVTPVSSQLRRSFDEADRGWVAGGGGVWLCDFPGQCGCLRPLATPLSRP